MFVQWQNYFQEKFNKCNEVSSFLFSLDIDYVLWVYMNEVWDANCLVCVHMYWGMQMTWFF